MKKQVNQFGRSSGVIKLGLERGQWGDWEGSSPGFLKGQPCVHRAVWLGWSQGIEDRQP